MKTKIVLTGCMHVDDRFISRKYVADVLAAQGCTVLKSLPKDTDATVIAGRMMGKKKCTDLLLTAAGDRGFEVVAFDELVTPRFKATVVNPTFLATNRVQAVCLIICGQRYGTPIFSPSVLSILLTVDLLSPRVIRTRRTFSSVKINIWCQTLVQLISELLRR